MNAWVRLKIEERCGNCLGTIQEQAIALELTFPHGTRASYRCQSCGEALLRVTAPEVPIIEALPVPQPSLPMELHRGPDFVKPAQVARSARFNALRDARQRQTGED